MSEAIRGLAGHSALLDALMKFVADYLLYGAVTVFVGLYLHRDGLRAGLAAGVGALVAVALAAAIGAIHYVPRPFVAGHFTPLVAHAADASFPSDHLAALGAVCAGAWFASHRIAAFAAVLALLVAFARVYVGIHYVSDVAAGFVLGMVAAAVVWAALRPAVPLIDAIDRRLQGWKLRPSERAPS